MFPTIEITLMGMKQSIMMALGNHAIAQEKDVAAAIDAAIKNFNIEAYLTDQITQALRSQVKNVVQEAVSGAFWGDPAFHNKIIDQVRAAILEKAFPHRDDPADDRPHPLEDIPADILQKVDAGADALDSLVEDCVSEIASNVNNQGAEAQIRYLREQGFSWKYIREAYGL